MDEKIEKLAALHSQIVDAREGYEEGRSLVEGEGLAEIFADLLGLHARHAADLAGALQRLGADPDEGGSFLQYVHKALLNIRAAIGRLDGGAIASLRDGEQRILASYDETIGAFAHDREIGPLLERQRDELAERIQRLQAMQSSDAL